MPYHQLIITAPISLRARIVDLVMRHGSLGVIERLNGISAYFPSSVDISPLKNELSIIGALLERSSSRQKVRVAQTELPDVDWNRSWKMSFRPILVGKRFSILPPWERPPRGRIPIIIDPGMAFGTGHHETTRSCLVLMEKYAGVSPHGRFLDVGTGTGLLAIAARRLGFGTVVGIDTDPLSIKAARENKMLNAETGIILRKGGIHTIRGVFRMITANLIAGTLMELAQEIADRTAPSGIAIMSGILKGQDAEVVAASKKAGLALRERMRDGKWISLALER